MSEPTAAAGSYMRALIAQIVRFGVAGGIVALVYLSSTTVLHSVLGVPFQAALVTGYASGLVVHFTLQRRFVWRAEAYALTLPAQAARYLPIAAAQYGITATATVFLPALFGVRVLFVYFVTVAIVTSANFVVFRMAIFHGANSPPPRREATALK